MNKHDIATFSGVCSTDILVFNSNDCTSAEYINRYLDLDYFFEYVLSNSKGIHLPRVTESVVLNAACPLPPLAEQQRIVDRIDGLFAKLNTARDKAQAVLDGYELRKAAILHRAFTGELTEQWRKDNGISLDSWIHGKLIDALLDKPRNGYSPKPVDHPTPFKSMTLSATTSGTFMPEHYKYINGPIPDDSYLWLQPGDILMQRANSIEKVGTSALYTGKAHEFIYPDLMMKIRVKKEASSEYIAYFLKSNDVMLFLRNNAVGIAGNMPKINQKTVSNIPVILPSIKEQRKIVQILDRLFLMESEVKDTSQRVIDSIDMMKKAILGRAFRGELGTNDPAEECPEIANLRTN